jgi:hypothetical protein
MAYIRNQQHMHTLRTPAGKTKVRLSWTRTPHLRCPIRMEPSSRTQRLSQSMRVTETTRLQVSELSIKQQCRHMFRTEHISARLSYGSALDPPLTSIQGHFVCRALTEIPACWPNFLPFVLILIHLLIVISHGLRLRGVFLPPYLCSHSGSTPKPPPLSLLMPPFIVGMIGLPPCHILGYGDPHGSLCTHQRPCTRMHMHCKE